MPYADSDFFLAIMKPNDWLKPSAVKLAEEHKGNIWTSGHTIVEILLIIEEFKLDPEIVVSSIFNIAEVEGLSRHQAFFIAHYMKHKGLRTFDAVHAAFCGNDKIISSDSVFDKLGFERIKIGR